MISILLFALSQLSFANAATFQVRGIQNRVLFEISAPLSGALGKATEAVLERALRGRKVSVATLKFCLIPK